MYSIRTYRNCKEVAFQECICFSLPVYNLMRSVTLPEKNELAIKQIESRNSRINGQLVTLGPSWGYCKSQFLSGRQLLATISHQHGATAPRTGLGYPHEGPFVERFYGEPTFTRQRRDEPYVQGYLAHKKQPLPRNLQ